MPYQGHLIMEFGVIYRLKIVNITIITIYSIAHKKDKSKQFLKKSSKLAIFMKNDQERGM